jgi:hypothetical protein
MSSISPATSTAAPPAKARRIALFVTAIAAAALCIWAAPMPHVEAPWLTNGVPVAETDADLLKLGADGTLHDARAFLVPSGTRIRIISVGLDKREVEIAEGPHRGRRGWLPLEWVK